VVAGEAQTAFISYSREDSEFALRLANDLKAAGAAVWLDQLDIAPGQRWARAIEDALNDCPRMVVILSPASVGSTNVDDEVSFALEEKKTVIPVLYRDCRIPFRLRPFQYLDFRSDYGRGLKALLKTLGAEQQQPPKRTSRNPVGSTIRKRSGTDISDASGRERVAQPAAKQTRLKHEDKQSGGPQRPDWKMLDHSDVDAALYSAAFATAQSGWALGRKGIILHTRTAEARGRGRQAAPPKIWIP
jgi:hypothetical protein